MSRLSGVKPAYNGTARGQIFSIAGGFRLIQVLEVKLKVLGTEKVFR
jgi:hypothetical protein